MIFEGYAQSHIPLGGPNGGCQPRERNALRAAARKPGAALASQDAPGTSLARPPPGGRMRLAQAWPGHLRGTGISHRPRPACDQILRRGHRPGPARAAPGPSLSRTSVSKISWDFWRSRRRFWRPPSEDFGGLRFEFLKPNQELFCGPKNKNILDPGGKISGDPGRSRQRFWRRRI